MVDAAVRHLGAERLRRAAQAETAPPAGGAHLAGQSLARRSWAAACAWRAAQRSASRAVHRALSWLARGGWLRPPRPQPLAFTANVGRCGAHRRAPGGGHACDGAPVAVAAERRALEAAACACIQPCRCAASCRLAAARRAGCAAGGDPRCRARRAGGRRVAAGGQWAGSHCSSQRKPRHACARPAACREPAVAGAARRLARADAGRRLGPGRAAGACRAGRKRRNPCERAALPPEPASAQLGPRGRVAQPLRCSRRGRAARRRAHAPCYRCASGGYAACVAAAAAASDAQRARWRAVPTRGSRAAVAACLFASARRCVAANGASPPLLPSCRGPFRRPAHA